MLALILAFSMLVEAPIIDDTADVKLLPTFITLLVEPPYWSFGIPDVQLTLLPLMVRLLLGLPE